MFALLRPATVISPDDRLDKILKMMKETQTFIVVDKGKYAGIVTDRNLRSMQNEPNSKISKVVWKAPVLRSNMDVEEASECFLQGYRELPVCEDGKVLGTMKSVDILKFMLADGRVPSVRASEVMSSPVTTIESDNSVAQAASLMRQQNIHHLVVTDKAGTMIGVMSSSDLTPLLERNKEKLPFMREKMGLSNLQLGSLIVPEVHTTRSGTILSEVAKQMIENDTSVLIISDDSPIGLVSILDIIKASLPTAELRFEIIGLDPEDKEYRDDLRREGVKALQKIGQMFPVEGGKLDVKKYSKKGSKAKYSMRLQIFGKERISVESSEWDMFKALHQVLKEAARLAKEMKGRLKGNKGHLGKRRAFSIKVRDGDISYGGKQAR
jgi:CBS domain-containing protein